MEFLPSRFLAMSSATAAQPEPFVLRRRCLAGEHHTVSEPDPRFSSVAAPRPGRWAREIDPAGINRNRLMPNSNPSSLRSFLKQSVITAPRWLPAAYGGPSRRRPTLSHIDISYPFNPDTVIRFDLVEAGHAELTLSNTAGQRVATLINGQRAAGAPANLQKLGAKMEALRTQPRAIAGCAGATGR